MRISTRLLILFIGIALVFGAFFYMFYHIKQEEMRVYQEGDTLQRREGINAVLRANESAQRSFTLDNASRDDLINFLSASDSVSTIPPLARGLDKMHYSLLQVYDRYGFILYSYADAAAPGLAEYLTDASTLDTLSVNSTIGYYTEFNLGILYCSISPIPLNPNNPQSTAKAGYLLIASRTDYVYLRQLASTLNYDVNISLDNPEGQARKESFEVLITVPLKSINNRTIAWLSFRSSNPFLMRLRALGNLILFGTMGFIFIFLLMQFFLIQQWITTPLALISESLKEDDPIYIDKLQSANNEFADVAHLVKNFFVQREKLVKEIEERTKTETRLREMEEQTRKILLTSPESIIVTDHNTRVLSASAETLHLLDWESEEAMLREGLSYLNIVHPKDLPLYEKMLSNLHQGYIARNQELRILRTDGSSFPALVSASIIEEQQGGTSKLIFVTRDLTELKDLEARLRQSQKMESIGTLAGGIAHDFNNIITIIAGYVALSMAKLKDIPDAQWNMNEALKACFRAKTLISKILTFSRQSEPSVHSLIWADAIEESLPMIRALIPAKIAIETSLNSRRYVNADNTELQQVMFNLATNAFHAMRPDGGTLYINLTEVSGFELIGLDPKVDFESSYLLLSVRDTGTGIPYENLARIFDPYFSTKGIGEGTGLGLSIVHGIITGYGGFITVQSHLNIGTSFNIYLPIVQEPIQSLPVNSEEEFPFIKAHILIVDDEAALSGIFGEALRDEGYEVNSFTDSALAFEHFSINSDSYDLIIADINMPQMDGIKLATAAKAIKDLPIILYTGFLDYSTQQRIEAAGVKHILTKPVLPDEMVLAVKKALYKAR